MEYDENQQEYDENIEYDENGNVVEYDEEQQQEEDGGYDPMYDESLIQDQQNEDEEEVVVQKKKKKKNKKNRREKKKIKVAPLSTTSKDQLNNDQVQKIKDVPFTPEQAQALHVTYSDIADIPQPTISKKDGNTLSDKQNK